MWFKIQEESVDIDSGSEDSDQMNALIFQWMIIGYSCALFLIKIMEVMSL